jgi:hypothetical protein
LPDQAKVRSREQERDAGSLPVTGEQRRHAS